VAFLDTNKMGNIKEKQDRLKKINELIKEIASHDRHFFFSKTNGNIARFFIKGSKIYYEDEYERKSKQIIFTNEEEDNDYGWHQLKWVNHGSTLKSQIFSFASFIRNGKKIYLGSYHWGYTYDGLIKIHHKAKDLGICSDASFSIYKGDEEEGDRVYREKEETA